MAALLEHYMAGEHLPVWAEIRRLSPLQTGHPSTADAIAVVYEAMRRARANVETIVSRLHNLGYEFASALPAHNPPDPDVNRALSRLERLCGNIPLALRAWYEIVGSVCLMGSHPELAFYSPSVLRDPPEKYSDPLMVLPVQAAIAELESWRGDEQTPVGWSPAMPIAPDDYHKENVSGGAPYEIRVPSSEVDPPLLNEWHNTTFVNYLRICFQRGGFPGWERYEKRPHTLLQELAEGLLPI